MVVAAASEPRLAEGLPEGLVAQILDGKVLRPDRIAACRRLLADGSAPDALSLADAMVREVARGVAIGVARLPLPAAG
jgi:hypothetical protein